MRWELIKFVGNDAILKNENGKIITWPHDLLSDDYSIGDKFIINFTKQINVPPENDEAKQIINTILKSD